MRFDFKSLHSDDRGLSTVEYVILLALLAISAMTAWQFFGDSLIGAAEESAETLDTMDPSGGGGGGSAGAPAAGAAEGDPASGNAAGAAGGSASGGGSVGGGGRISAGATGAAPSQGGSGVIGGGSASTMGGGTVITSSSEAGGGGEESENRERASGIYVAPGTDEEDFDVFGFGAVMSVFFALALPLMIMLKKARGHSPE